MTKGQWMFVACFLIVAATLAFMLGTLVVFAASKLAELLFAIL